MRGCAMLLSLNTVIEDIPGPLLCRALFQFTRVYFLKALFPSLFSI